MPTIFVLIAAYRDPQLVPTIEDCLARASHPDRLRFGICWQRGPEEPDLPWMKDSRFGITAVNWHESRGCCWARAEALNHYEGEDFYLQLDSHHRFVSGWDAIALDELQRTGDPRAVLTTYGTPFDPERPEERSWTPMQMNFDRFTEDGIPLFRPGELHEWRTRSSPARARFLSGHFVFAPAAFARDVPSDPEIYFTGDEITLTVRAFTHGYNLYHPSQIVVWHEYSREYRPHKHWTDHTAGNRVPIEWHVLDGASRERVQRFLAAPEAGPYGVGTARTLADYENFAGLSMKSRRAQDYTRAGFEPPNPAAPVRWAEEIRSYTLELTVERQQLPEEVDDYRFWYVGIHDESGQELFRQDVEGEELADVLRGADGYARVVRTFESDRVPVSWTIWPVSDSRGWLERIDGPVQIP